MLKATIYFKNKSRSSQLSTCYKVLLKYKKLLHIEMRKEKYDVIK